jgi:hypothetical protein
VNNCLGQYGCILQCDGGPLLQDLFTCSLGSCGQCNPPAECVALGACFDAIDGGQQFHDLYQGVVRDDILSLDPNNCKSRKESLAAQVGASAPDACK